MTQPKKELQANKDNPVPEDSPVVLADPETGIVSLTTAMSSKDLKAAVKLMTEQRKIIADFVKENLVKDVDYGQIEATSKAGKSFKSKPTLYKPGMEKILSLFGLATELKKDTQTLEMTDIRNAIAFKCVITRNGQKIAEGRGAAVVGDMGRDLNSTIKIAEKRARMDACLSLGFSEYFTQDMDDSDYRQKPKFVPNNQASRPPAIDPEGPVTDKQRKTMFALMHKAGINEPDAMKLTLKLNGFPESTKEMTVKDASAMIDMLVRDDFIRPEEDQPPATDDDLPVIDIDESTDVDKEVGDAIDTFLITDELKAELAENINTLGLSAQGRLRMLKEVTGHITLNALKDGDWMALSQKVDDVLNDKIKLPAEWLAKEETKTTPKQTEIGATK